MNGIRATYDLIVEQWTIEIIDLQPEQNSLEFVFISENRYADLTDCQFGFCLESNGQILKSSKLPPEGVKYFQIANTPWFIDDFSLIVGQEYKLSVYITSSQTSRESQITFMGPKPIQPFPSWTWRDNQWNAPKEKPDGPHIWDEQTQQWEQAEAHFPYPTK